MATKSSKNNGVINNDYSIKDMGSNTAEMSVDTGEMVRNLNAERGENTWQDVIQHAQDEHAVASFAVDTAQLSGLNAKSLASKVGVTGDLISVAEFVSNWNNEDGVKINVNNTIELLGSMAGYVIPGADTALTAYSIAIGEQGYMSPDDFSFSTIKSVAKEVGKDLGVVNENSGVVPIDNVAELPDIVVTAEKPEQTVNDHITDFTDDNHYLNNQDDFFGNYLNQYAEDNGISHINRYDYRQFANDDNSSNGISYLNDYNLSFGSGYWQEQQNTSSIGSEAWQSLGLDDACYCEVCDQFGLYDDHSGHDKIGRGGSSASMSFDEINAKYFSNVPILYNPTYYDNENNENNITHLSGSLNNNSDDIINTNSSTDDNQIIAKVSDNPIMLVQNENGNWQSIYDYEYAQNHFNNEFDTAQQEISEELNYLQKELNQKIDDIGFDIGNSMVLDEYNNQSSINNDQIEKMSNMSFDFDDDIAFNNENNVLAKVSDNPPRLFEDNNGSQKIMTFDEWLKENPSNFEDDPLFVNIEDDINDKYTERDDSDEQDWLF